MIDTVTFRGRRSEVRDMLEKTLASTNGDSEGVLYGLKLRVGQALLSQIHQDFIIKMHGGTGFDGIKWKPLSPKTIAQRRVSSADRKEAGLTRANRNRGLLTAEENRQWKQLFVSKLARLRLDMPDKDAKGIAAAHAWTVLKYLGAKTKLAVFGNRKVDILRDTGELLRSFSPGVADHPSGAEGQVFRLEGNVVAVGSNKKPQHHKGIPGKLPARPFWPLDDVIPEPWWPAIRIAAVNGMHTAARLLFGKT